MARHWLNTDGPLPDDTPVAVRFPAHESGEPTPRPERAGTVVGRVGDDEWEIAVDDPRATERRDGAEFSPYVYRRSDEMRVLTMTEYDEMIAEANDEIAHRKASRWRQECDEFDQAVERAKAAGATREQILEAIDAGLDLDDYAHAVDEGADHADVIAAKVEFDLDPSDYGYQLRTGMSVAQIMELQRQAQTDRETDLVDLTADGGERNTGRRAAAAAHEENKRLRSLLNEVHRTLSDHFGHAEAPYTPWALELLSVIEIDDEAAEAEREQADHRKADTDQGTDAVYMTSDGGAPNTDRGAQTATETGKIGRPGSGATWLDRVPHQDVVERLLERLDEEFADQATYLEMAGGDACYSLWLRLADEHLDTLPRSGETPIFPWRSAYDHGWSPRDAAFAAWSGVGENPQLLADMNLAPTPSRSELIGKETATDEEAHHAPPPGPSI